MDKSLKIQKEFDDFIADSHRKAMEILKNDYIAFDHLKTFFDEKKTYFITNEGQIYSSLKNVGEHNSHIFTPVISAALTTIGEDEPELDVELSKKEPSATEPSATNSELQEPSTLVKHKEYIKDFSIKVGCMGAAAVAANGLIAVGVPSFCASLMATGLKITGYSLVGGFIGYKNLDPETKGIAKGFILGKITPSLSTTYSFLTGKDKKIMRIGQVEEKPSVVEPNVVMIPGVNQPEESHSIWEFFDLISSITWKVLKKVHDLL